jgi:hypothetical protein
MCLQGVGKQARACCGDDEYEYERGGGVCEVETSNVLNQRPLVHRDCLRRAARRGDDDSDWDD